MNYEKLYDLLKSNKRYAKEIDEKERQKAQIEADLTILNRSKANIKSELDNFLLDFVAEKQAQGTPTQEPAPKPTEPEITPSEDTTTDPSEGGTA
jgi:hypothetical protein